MHLTNYTFFNPKNLLYIKPVKGLRGYSLSYRFAFNGKEKDDEVKGAGNSIAFEARIYDPRLGRFLSVDPWSKEYPWQSSYAYFANSPIWKIDYKGMGDPTKKPEISSANSSKNSNRFKMVDRHRADGSVYRHTGVDIKTNNGDNIYSIKPGTVVAVTDNFEPNEYKKNSLGNTITIKTELENGEAVYIQYAHLNKVSAYEVGQSVEENAKIGEAGASGNPGKKSNGTFGIADKDRHVHIEASTKMFDTKKAVSFYGMDKNRVSVEDYMDTKFDKKGNTIEGTGTKVPFKDEEPKK